MSGVTGAERIKSRQDFTQFVNSYKEIISKFPGVKSITPSGSINSNIQKQTFGDIDLIIHISSDRTKKDVKNDLVTFFNNLPSGILLPFTSEKYSGKLTYNSGEIVSIRYYDAVLNYSVQIDNIIALSELEADFKRQFLNMPAPTQGLVLGLTKTALINKDKFQIFKDLRIPYDILLKDQEYEFNLSSTELQLRKITYKPGTFIQLHKEVCWSSTNFNNVIFLLNGFNTSNTFDQLLTKIKTHIVDNRSKVRIYGVFKSMITVKSGEVGTEKGFEKISSLNKLKSALEIHE